MAVFIDYCLVYSPLNSAKVSCSNEVTLVFRIVTLELYNRPKKISKCNYKIKYVDPVAFASYKARSGFIHSFYFFTLLYYCRAIFSLSFYSNVQRPSFPFFTIELTLLLKQHCYFQISHPCTVQDGPNLKYHFLFHKNVSLRDFYIMRPPLLHD